jgi:hypothetical protein
MEKKETQERQSLKSAQQGFLSSVSNDITNDRTESSSEKTKIIKQATIWLKQKFRNAHHWIVGCREDGSVFKVPATTRGNQTYAYYQTARVLQIQNSLKNKTKIADSATNALFVTLTQRYNTNSTDEINKTWINTRPALIKFKAGLRKLGMIDYAMTLEAHENGGCHAHMIAIFDKTIKMHATKGDKYSVNDIELLYKIKKAWANALGYNMDSAFVDILACGDGGLTSYIMKELKKTTSCEKAMQRVEVNNDKPEDRKKILAFYFADRNRMRLLYVSKGLSAEPEPEEGETPQAEFITNVISEPPKGQRVLCTCIITRAELLKMVKYEEISPYTGIVDVKTAEYEAIMRIFEERYGISEVLNNKAELERVIAERNERKVVKMQTKIIAEEAIHE